MCVFEASRVKRLVSIYLFSASHESILSFVKDDSTSQEENQATQRTSKRTSSKRASLAITGLSTPRRGKR